MGFKYWYEGLMFIVVFGAMVGVPCYFTAVIGSKMLNDLGNFPTKSAQIQSSAAWKILIIEVVTFGCFAVFFNILS